MDSATWTQATYGALVSITKRMRRYDRYDQIEAQARSLIDDAFQKIDQSYADVLIKGFATTAYTDTYGQSVSAAGLDALALFHASHTNGSNSETFRNLIRYNSTDNPLLSREAVVEARVDAYNYKAPNGVNRPIELDRLLVCPALYDQALRIVGSQLLPGESTNDINPVKGLVTVEQWAKLTAAADATDSSAYWYMYDSSKVGESLKSLFGERPSLDAPEQVYKNKNWDWSLDFDYTIGRAFPAFIRGSNATEA